VRKSLGSLAALVVLFVLLGVTRGWYSVGRLPSEDGHSAFRIDIDRVKVGQDLRSAGRWIQRVLSRKKKQDAPAEEPPPAKDGAP
jgi:hypothetical protein